MARSTNGYPAVFTHNEPFNNPPGKLYAENDQPTTTDGAFVLLATDDVVTGVRHVKWQNRIEIRKGRVDY